MEFTDLYKQSNSLVAFSPDGHYIAVAVEHRLIVRDTENPKRIQRVYACEYPAIQDLSWSSDSQYILTASYMHDRVDVWSLEDEQWRCSITDEVSRVARALWAPDGRHILTMGELELRLSVWSLETGACRYMENPKAGRSCLAFHPDGSYMAVVQRHDYRDFIGIYGVGRWEMAREIPLEHMVDCAGVAWSPDGLHLCAWDMGANASAVVFNAIGMVKRALVEDGLGTGRAVWSPTGEFLALCGMDRTIHMLNELTWRSIATLMQKPTVPVSADVFVETNVDVPLAQQAKALGGTGAAAAARQHSKFDLETPTLAEDGSGDSQPVRIRVRVPADIHRAKDRPAVRAMFSADGALLATHDESMPNCVWVWAVDEMRCRAVVQMMAPVREFKWSPVENVLAMVTGSSNVYLWQDAKGCMVCEVPAVSALAVGVRWNPNGDSLAVLAKGLFCLALLPV
ncbi:WD repeat-containing protein wrap73 [Linderina macrospora]|uniref:WD repeat-containing protein wrap73 n=1 Tax=Linderina macrospora TaxID=4868 RepID=A0ACC1JGF5_9FUNG|nr:WD repeat-containing protein wrap73 [Linderina macrospora]